MTVAIDSLPNTPRLSRSTPAQIAQLSPTLGSSSDKYIDAVVSLLWPYSSSSKRFVLLLADPDFRLRRNKGQVKVAFLGPSAKAVASSKVGIGDLVRLCLDGANWIHLEEDVHTPGKSADWDISFKNRIELEVYRDGDRQASVNLDQQSPSQSPERLESTNGAATYTPTRFLGRQQSQTEAFSSPSFRKLPLSYGSLLDPTLSQLVEDDGSLLGHGRKRTKFSRQSGEWRYMERSPSPPSDVEEIPIAQPSVPPEEDSQNGVFEPTMERPGRSSVSPAGSLEAGTSSPDVMQSNDHVEESSAPDTQDRQTVQFVIPPLPQQREKDSTSPTSPVSSRQQTQPVQLPNTTTPRLGPLPSPGLPLVSPLIKAPGGGRGYFPPFSRTASELDMSAQHPQNVDLINVPLEPNQDDAAVLVSGDDGILSSLEQHIEADLTSDRSDSAEDLAADSPSDTDNAPDTAGRLDDDLPLIHGPSTFTSSTGDDYNVIRMDQTPLSSTFGSTAPTTAVEMPRSPSPVPQKTREEAVIVLSDSESETGSVQLETGYYQDDADVNPSTQTAHFDLDPVFAEVQRDHDLDMYDVSDEEVSPVALGNEEVQSLADVMQAVDKDVSSHASEATSPEEAQVSTSPSFEERPQLGRKWSQDHREKLVISATECIEENLAMSPPSFPFKQRWDAQARNELRNRRRRRSQQGYDGSADDSADDEVESASDESDAVASVASGSEEIFDPVDKPSLPEPSPSLQPSYELPSPEQKTQSREDLTSSVNDGTELAAESGAQVKDASVLQEEPQHQMNLAPALATQQAAVNKEERDLIILGNDDDDDEEDAETEARTSTMTDQPPSLQEIVAAESPVGDGEVEFPDAISPEFALRKPEVADSVDHIPESMDNLVSSQTHSPELVVGTEGMAEPHEPMAISESIDGIITGQVQEKRPVQGQLFTPDNTQEEQPKPLPAEAEQYLRIGDSATPRITQKVEDAANLATPISVMDGTRDIETPDSKPMAPPLFAEGSHRSKGKTDIVSPWFTPRRLSRSQDDPDTLEQNVVDEGKIMTNDQDVKAVVPAIIFEQTDDTVDTPKESAPTSIEGQTKIPADVKTKEATIDYSKWPKGLRTRLSYFPALSGLSSHFNQTVDVIALCSSPSTNIKRAPAGPKDYHTTLHITDPTLWDDGNATDRAQTRRSTSQTSTTVQAFRPWRNALPVTREGDVVLLRLFKVQSRKHQMMLLSTDGSGWAVFRAGGGEPDILGPPVEFGNKERQCVAELQQWWADIHPSDESKTGVVSSSKATLEASANLNVGTPSKGHRRRSSRLSQTSLDSAKPEPLLHELRDGLIYTDEPIEEVRDRERSLVHELRDGTTYIDPDGNPPSQTSSPAHQAAQTTEPGSTYELRDGSTWTD